jgi:NADPH-dependent 7-cyano-7-deazaguanine reductase QueF
MTDLTVPCPAAVRVTVTMSARHLCPFKPEVDRGEMEISWRTDGNTIELHALAALLASQAQWVISHEEFTAWLTGELSALDGLTVETVTSRWVTAGGQVSVSSQTTGIATQLAEGGGTTP